MPKVDATMSAFGKRGESKVPFQLLTSPCKKSVGAMFKKSLGETMLVFPYPQAEYRLFHTFFCPPLRLIGLDNHDLPVFDRTVQPGRFVWIPSARTVIETEPEVDYVPLLADILAACADTRVFPTNAGAPPNCGGIWEASAEGLFFALIAGSVADMRRVREAHRRTTLKVDAEVLRRNFAAWERGQIAGSAGFLLDFSDVYSLPPTAVRLAREVLAVEGGNGSLDEILAAAVAGRPWKSDFATACLRCGKTASWRMAVSVPTEMPPEYAWRYQRPENHVPLCHKCAARLNWNRNEQARVNLAWGLWGLRYEAFWRWHRALEDNRHNGSPGYHYDGWDKSSHPLWPANFGGECWETGSGALQHADPRPYRGVRRTPEQSAALAFYIGEYPKCGHKKPKLGHGPETPLLDMIASETERTTCHGD
jgi:hypothetical protein